MAGLALLPKLLISPHFLPLLCTRLIHSGLLTLAHHFFCFLMFIYTFVSAWCLLIVVAVVQAKDELGWEATRGLEEMCADAWRWQESNPTGFPEPAEGELQE